ncbi:S8 family serine peptidase, partial [Actinomadura fibrosa]|uniref:S8 family serine peptidase n=1 Tax=Actinomadura fibrosa TaxID=111802 RepID=UPI001F5ECB90
GTIGYLPQDPRGVDLAALAGGLLPLASAPARADEVRARQRPVLDILGMDAAWRITRGRGVTVAVVDTGVDPNQADLKGSVTTGPNMIAQVDAGSKPAREHGTGMASLIAGHGHGPGGGAGIIGLAPEARILAVRAIGEPEDPSYARYKADDSAEDGVARGIRYAADHGADVINLSLGKDDEVPAERAAIAYAIGKGVVVVSAVGNDGDKERELDADGFAPYSYPASYPGVIAVAATAPGHARAPFSNRNYSVLVAAPGAGLAAAGPGGDYFITSGTSDSSALVSGIAALIRAKYPKLPPALVSQALVAGTRYGPSGKYDPEIGFGEVNAQRALAAAASLTSGRPATSAGKPARQRFGAGDPGPVDVIDRPIWVKPVITVILLVGVGGTLISSGVAITFARRHPRTAPTGGPSSGPATAGGPPTGGGPPLGAAPGAAPPFGARFASPPGARPATPGGSSPGPHPGSQGDPSFGPPERSAWTPPGRAAPSPPPAGVPSSGRPSFGPPEPDPLYDPPSDPPSDPLYDPPSDLPGGPSFAPPDSRYAPQAEPSFEPPADPPVAGQR